MKTMKDFIFLGSKITVYGDWNCEIKRWLLLGRKTMINLDSILKSRDITLPTKVHLVETIVSPVVMWGCESWTIRKAMCVCLVAPSCLTLWDTMDCSPWGSSVRGDSPGKNTEAGSDSAGLDGAWNAALLINSQAMLSCWSGTIVWVGDWDVCWATVFTPFQIPFQKLCLYSLQRALPVPWHELDDLLSMWCSLRYPTQLPPSPWTEILARPHPGL